MKLTLLYESKAFKKRQHRQLDRVATEHGYTVEDLYNYLLSIDPTDKKYLSWLLVNFDYITRNTADIRDALNRFEELIQKGADIDADIGTYTPESLSVAIDNFQDYESKGELSSKESLLDKGFKKVKETKNFVTYQALDPHILAKFVKGRTPWCVANVKHAKNYIKYHGMYLVLDKSDLEPYLCFSGDYTEFYNIMNKEMMPQPIEHLKAKLGRTTQPFSWTDALNSGTELEAELKLAAYLPQHDFYWQYRTPRHRLNDFNFSKYMDDLYSNPDIAIAWMEKNLWVSKEEFEAKDAEIKAGRAQSARPGDWYAGVHDAVMNDKVKMIMNNPQHKLANGPGGRPTSTHKLLRFIASDPAAAYKFAEVTQKPFLMGEKAILTSPWHTAIYSKFKHKTPGSRFVRGYKTQFASFDEWPEARPVVTQDMDALVKWCQVGGKGRLPEYEEQIATTGSPYCLLLYATFVARSDWHKFVPKDVANKAEATIFQSPASHRNHMYEYARIACSQFNRDFRASKKWDLY